MHKGRRVFLWLLLPLLAGTLSGCLRVGKLFPAAEPARPQGRVQLVVRLPAPQGGDLLQAVATAVPVQRVAVRFLKDGRVVERELAVSGGQAAGEFTLWPGRWQVTALGLDAEGVARYQGATTVDGFPEGTTRAEIVLTASLARLELEADLSSYDGPDPVESVVVRFEPRPATFRYTFERLEAQPGTAIFARTLEVPPQTYDYRFELYKAAGVEPGNLIYAPPWQRVDLQPGETVRLRWNPGAGGVSVTGTINPPPPAPTLLAAEVVEARLRVAWQPVTTEEADLASYRVYLRKDIFEEFRLVDEAPGSATERLISASPWSGRTVWLAVTAVDTAGQESLRSNELQVTVP